MLAFEVWETPPKSGFKNRDKFETPEEVWLHLKTREMENRRERGNNEGAKKVMTMMDQT